MILPTHMAGKGLYRNMRKEFGFSYIPVSSGMRKFRGVCEIEAEDESLGEDRRKGLFSR